VELPRVKPLKAPRIETLKARGERNWRGILPQSTRDLGELQAAQQGLGQIPGRKRILVNLYLGKHFLCQQFLPFHCTTEVLNCSLGKIIPGQNDTSAQLCHGSKGTFSAVPVESAPMHWSFCQLLIR